MKEKLISTLTGGIGLLFWWGWLRTGYVLGQNGMDDLFWWAH